MRTNLSIFGLGVSLALVACGGDDGGGGQAQVDAPAAPDVGFNKPTASLKANIDNVEMGPADLSCLGQASSDAASMDVTLNTKVTDFQNGNAIANATVTAFDGVDSANPFVTGTSDSMGDLSLHIGAGHKRFGFKMTAAGQIDTLLLFQYLDPTVTTTTEPGKIQSVSNSTAATLPALIGETRTAGSGVLAGALRDCSLHEISNFIATVSSTSGTATSLAKADTYYFNPQAGLPVHHNQQDAASANGLFMVIQLPVTPTAYVQMWGYATDADKSTDKLTLISELQVPVLADTVITGSFEPDRAK